jgi:hypothetical protein
MRFASVSALVLRYAHAQDQVVDEALDRLSDRTMNEQSKRSTAKSS